MGEEDKNPIREVHIKKIVCTDGLSSVNIEVTLKGPDGLETLITKAKGLMDELK